MAMVVEDMGSVAVSPRISFSHDLSQSDLSPAAAAVPIVRMDTSIPLDASIEFNFSLTTGRTSFDSSLADDLFSDGMLLPLPIKEQTSASSTSPMPAAAASSLAPAKPPAPRPPYLPMANPRKRGSLREVMARTEDEDVDARRCSPAQQKASSFWRFGRSSSLNYRGKRTGGLCPFLLLRSKSTGSAPTPNPARSRGPCNIHGIGNNTTTSATTTTTTTTTSSSSPPPSFRRLPNEPAIARRYYYSGSSGRSYDNGVRIGPILNVPVPAPSSLNVFNYLLCSCGDKSNRRGPAIT